jgi:hypothetical protein
MNYIPLIFATAAILAVFAFAAEAGSGLGIAAPAQCPARR